VTKATDELKDRLRVEAERIEEDCMYNYMGHYSAATRWQSVDLTLGFPTFFLSGVAAFLIFPLPAVATAFSVVTTLLALATLYFRPAETAALHFRSGGKFKSLREKARLFREVALRSSGMSEEQLVKGLQDLSDEKRIISELGVPLPDFAYRIAKGKIEAGQAAYEVDRPRHE
jgi:hypothetical protein